MAVTHVSTINPAGPNYEKHAADNVARGFVKTDRTTTHHPINSETGQPEPVVMEIWHKREFEGAVLDRRERNFYHDSDFYAVVWTGEKIAAVEYATTRFAGGGFADVDATEEVKAQATAYLEKWLLENLTRFNRVAARKPEKGRTVEVVEGRKIKHGTIGKVFWYGRGRNFSPSRYAVVGMRVGFKDDAGATYWADADRVRVLDPEKYEKSAAELAEIARNRAGRTPFHAPVSGGAGMLVL